MTKSELSKIIDESMSELSKDLTVDKIRRELSKTGSSNEDIIAGAIYFSVNTSKELLIRVLSKALCKD